MRLIVTEAVLLSNATTFKDLELLCYFMPYNNGGVGGKYGRVIDKAV